MRCVFRRPSLIRGLVLVTAVWVSALSIGKTSPAASLPLLAIVSPVNGSTVRGPLSIVFETPADLSQMTMTKDTMARKLPHLHIDLDKRVLMPTMSQLVRLGGTRYRYHLGNVAAGVHTVRVYWASGQTHKPIGTAQTVTVTVR